MPRSTLTSGSSICSYYTAPSDYDTTDDYYSNLPVTSTELRTRTDNPGTWPLRSRRTDPRLSERTTRYVYRAGEGFDTLDLVPRIFVPADSISGEVHIDSEILARGYNPSYYGDIAPIAGSSRTYISWKSTPNRTHHVGRKSCYGVNSKFYHWEVRC